jgi:hypothetical protein
MRKNAKTPLANGVLVHLFQQHLLSRIRSVLGTMGFLSFILQTEKLSEPNYCIPGTFGYGL